MKLSKHFISAAAVLLLGWMSLADAGTLYGKGGNGGAGASTIDPTIPSETFIGLYVNGGNIGARGMACDSSGTLYTSGVTGLNDNDGLATVNRVTGEATVVGEFSSTTTAFPTVTALAFDSLNGVMYGISFDTGQRVLVTVNTATAALTVVGPLGAVATLASGLAYNPLTDALYATDNTNLYTIDRVTGQATVIGAHGQSSAGGLAFDADTQTLYMGSGLTLSTVNTTTGTATAVAPGFTPPILFGFGELAVCGAATAVTTALAVPMLSPILLVLLALFLLAAPSILGRRKNRMHFT